MSWQLTRGLQNLLDQFNAAFPDRDHTSDGTIGDAAHQAETSGHNPDDTPGSKPEWDGDPDHDPEVRAEDLDSDLRVPASLGHPAVTMQMVVDHLRALPGLNTVIRYMIYNRTMYHERDGFAPTSYTGASAHTEHLHVSGAWSQAADNNTTFDYHLEDLVALTDDDITRIVTAIKNADINPDPGSNYSLAGALWTMYGRTGALNEIPDQIDAVAATVNGFADPATLAAALAQPLAAVLAPLIPVAPAVSPDELETAIVAAFRALAAPAS